MSTTDSVTEEVGAPAESVSASLPLTIGGAAALILLWALLQLWGLGELPVHTHGEAREGLVVSEIVRGRSWRTWVLPLRDGPTGIEVPSKPPLFHWLAALTSFAVGRMDEWSIRLPSAALSLAGGLCTYAAGTALWGPAAGLLGATITVTSFEWQRAATGARVDMALTFGLLLASFAYLFFLRSGLRTRWLVPFYGGMAFAVLAKGPVGVALPALLALAAALVQRDASPLRRLYLVRGLIAVAIIAGLWYLLALIEGGFAFFGKQILNENVYRFMEPNEYEGGHRHSVLYLVGALATGFMPWTLFLPALAVGLWRARREITATDPRTYLLLWVAIVFAFYSIVVSKRSVYLLGLYPALGLLLGWWWATAARDAAETLRWLRTGLRIAAFAAMTVLIAIWCAAALEAAGIGVLSWAGQHLSPDAALYGRWIGETFRHRTGSSLLALAAAAGSLWVLAVALRAGSWGRVFGVTLASLSVISLLITHIIMPDIAWHKTYRAVMPAVRQVVGDRASLSFYRTFQYEAVFYWNGHIATYEGDLDRNAPPYVLMERDEWERATSVQREHFEHVTLPAPLEDGDGQRLILVRRRGA